MSVSELSASMQNYLKAIWSLSEWSNRPVTTSLIAERMGVRLSSVSDAVRKMTEQGLVSHSPYSSVELTQRGKELALQMVRRHRLIETFLVDVLDYSQDEVHEEAEHLEHAVSDKLINRIDKLLRFPSRDPHGDPIPTADGELEIPKAHQLTGVPVPAVVTVERISDEDSSLLQFLETNGIAVGKQLRIGAGAQYTDSLEVYVDNATSALTLGHSATDAIYVALAENE